MFAPLACFGTPVYAGAEAGAGHGSPKKAKPTRFQVRRVLKLEQPLRHGDYVWRPEGAPKGRITIAADLKAETLSVFRGGYEIGVAAILYGVPSHPTPLGSFQILQKDADHKSNIYHAPMPYMLRLTNDGVAIHGSKVSWGTASHGCIGVPVEFAKLLFAQAKLGDSVIITRYKN
ncbi:L,D-transpeptidase family protein [Sphingomonas sp. PP-CC-3A-396]|uniref:L,D-transpeptidase family protein n=1 Tax=Sphingomonas sp. PP-CC-3A-396 TaxID=2135655 RepID=UPI001FB786C5|nr:L,D-transpeptidase family protein [Sphingomonas sp. PP-CC-3A-396]